MYAGEPGRRGGARSRARSPPAAPRLTPGRVAGTAPAHHCSFGIL